MTIHDYSSVDNLIDIGENPILDIVELNETNMTPNIPPTIPPNIPPNIPPTIPKKPELIRQISNVMSIPAQTIKPTTKSEKPRRPPPPKNPPPPRPTYLTNIAYNLLKPKTKPQFKNYIPKSERVIPKERPPSLPLSPIKLFQKTENNKTNTTNITNTTRTISMNKFNTKSPEENLSNNNKKAMGKYMNLGKNKSKLIRTKSSSENPYITEDDILRIDGYLVGFVNIKVSSKVIFKKLSNRFFTLEEGILKMWKSREECLMQKIPERFIDLTQVFNNVMDLNNIKKNTRNKQMINKYLVSGMMDNDEMSYFQIKERKENAKKLVDVVLITSENTEGLKSLHDEIKIILNTFF